MYNQSINSKHIFKCKKHYHLPNICEDGSSRSLLQSMMEVYLFVHVFHSWIHFDYKIE